MKDRDKAIQFLKEAVARGYDNKYWIARDPDLASLRGDPEFKLLVK